ncbi:MAG: ATP-binding protein [Rhizomicrobium sp.]
MAPRAAARGLTIGYDVDSGLPHVLADERAFKQIVLNLLSNAVKFTPERGHIAVAFHRAAEGGTLLKVEDSGPGHSAGKAREPLQAVQPDRQSLRTPGRRHRPRPRPGEGARRAAWRALLDREARWAAARWFSFTFR